MFSWLNHAINLQEVRKLAGYSVKSSSEANAGWLKFWWRAMTAPGHCCDAEKTTVEGLKKWIKPVV